MIRSVKIEDAKDISTIYNYYVVNTVITFEEKEITSEGMKDRILSRNTHLPWLVLEQNNRIIGYAYAHEWKMRSAYKHTVESSIYLCEIQSNKGFGTKLYTELIDQLKKLNIHSVIGGISLPNEASIHLHEKLGFEKVAQFKEVGCKFNKWVDVGYWELLIV